MALRRTTKSVDGTIPVQALLYDDEEIYATQDGVGMYDGMQKSPNHQAGTVVITTHRLFYIDARKAYRHSFSLDLSFVTQTDYYAGLFKSSPKVTLHLSANSSTSYQDTQREENAAFETWECDVCAYRNPPGLSPAAAKICGLCGVPRSSVQTAPTATVVSQRHLSSSLPASAGSSMASLTTSQSPSGDSSSSIACPVCTFLNHPSLRSCEMCSSDLPRIPQSRRAMKSAPSSRPSSPEPDDDDQESSIIKISFRKGGVKEFYAVLKRSLKGKMWESNRTGTSAWSPDPTLVADRGTVGRSGITGILQNVEISAQGRENSMQGALQDLEALMVKAKDMVRLAAELNDKLTAATAETQSFASPVSSTEPEEATFIRSSLSQLGLQMSNAPVTQDMIKDERRWTDELARELAQVLQGSSSTAKKSGLMKSRGIIALDEVWGGWNRARGVALIPPSTFLLVLPHLPLFSDPPIQTRTFASGLRVLHTPFYTHAAFSARLSGMLALSGPKTTVQVAQEEGMTLGLSAEMIAAVEVDGDICRDDPGCAIVGGGEEVRWCSNVFSGYSWDGQKD